MIIKHKYNIGNHWYAIIQDGDSVVEVHISSERGPDEICSIKYNSNS